MAEVVQVGVGDGTFVGDIGRGIFQIQQIRRVGGGPLEGGQVFEWVAGDKAPDPSKGGARACPEKPWGFEIEHHTVRTNYPGATLPSVQRLGPRRGSTTLRGRFDDRYNFRGFAQREMRRLEKLVEDGAFVRISYGANVFEGTMDKAAFSVRRAWDIDYEITVDIHRRPDDGLSPTRSPAVARGPLRAFDDADLVTSAMLEAHDSAPRLALGTDIGRLADDALQSLMNARDQLAATLDGRELAAISQPVDVFRRLSTQFRGLASGAFGTFDALYEARSDLDVGARTAMSVIKFEDWSRSMRWSATLLMGSAFSASREVQEHTAPYAVAMYRPQAGESLYAISTRFFGTPNAWRAIADRNSLHVFTLTGDELLIIPERGTR